MLPSSLSPSPSPPPGGGGGGRLAACRSELVSLLLPLALLVDEGCCRVSPIELSADAMLCMNSSLPPLP